MAGGFHAGTVRVSASSALWGALSVGDTGMCMCVLMCMCVHACVPVCARTCVYSHLEELPGRAVLADSK